MHACMYIYIYILYIWYGSLSINQPINQPMKFIYLFIYLSVCPPVRPSILPSIHPSIHPPIEPFFPVCLSVFLSFFLSFYLFALYVKLCETMNTRCTGRETHTHVRQSISTSSKIFELCSSLLPATARNQNLLFLKHLKQKRRTNPALPKCA